MFNLPQISPITTIKPATILKLKIYSIFLFPNNTSWNKFINRKIKILWISTSNHALALAVRLPQAAARQSRRRSLLADPARGGPHWGLAELPPTRRCTDSARTGGPGLDARRPEVLPGLLLPRRCPTRAGGPRPRRAAAGGVARPAPPALVATGADAQ